MKKLYSLILFVLITTTAFSQLDKNIHTKKLSSIDKIKAIEAYNARIQLGAIATMALDSFTDETLNGPTFLIGVKSHYFYDKQGKDTLTIKYYRNKPQDPWVLFNKYEYLYNSMNQLVTIIEYNADSNITWVKASKATYTYNSSSYIIEKIDSFFDSSTNSFYIRSKSSYTHDSFGNILTATHYSITSIGSPLFPNNLELIIYDNASRVIKYTILQWNGNLNIWKNSSKVETVFNSFQKMDSNISFLWNDTLFIWDTINMERSAYNSFGDLITYDFYYFSNFIKYHNNHDICTYNSNHEIIERLFLRNSGNPQLDTNSKAIYSRDNLGNITSELYYGWKVFNNSGWDTSMRLNYTFNTNYLVNDVIFPFSFNMKYESDYIFLRWNQEMYDPFNNKWNTWYLGNYYYSSKIIDGIDQGNQNPILVYPNPSKDLVHFDLSDNIQSARIEIYDLIGKLVLEEFISSDHNISVESLSNGVYLYNLSIDNTMITGKLMVK